MKSFRIAIAALSMVFCVLLPVKQSAAVLMHYTVEHNKDTNTTLIENFSDSLGSLLTFSILVDPYSIGGAYNPIFVVPGGFIEYFGDGTFDVTGLGETTKHKNGKVPKDKTWQVWVFAGGTDEDVLKYNRGTGMWEPIENTGELVKTSDWLYIPAVARVEFRDTKTNYGYRTPRSDEPQKVHVGRANLPAPPDPGEVDSDPVPNNFFFPGNQPQAFLAYGTIEVPETDSLDFFSVYTPVAGVGSVPEPATIALLGLGVAGIAYKRRKK